MSCSLDTVGKYIAAAIAALLAAIALGLLWIAAIPLFAAAALVVTVSLYLIPHIKQALLDYAACRGPGKCTISNGVNNLGQAAASLSLISFTLAAVLEVAALGFISTWFLAAIGVTLQAAVLALVHTGELACAIVVLILIGVLSDAFSYKSCMDRAANHTNPGPVEET
jgi:hypothetical protein